MEYMLVFYQTPEWDHPEVYAEMGQFAGKLAAAGKMLGGRPLHPISEGARIRCDGETPTVTDGPFIETPEIIGGYFMIEVESRDEALEIAKGCPHARYGTVEVREVMQIGPPPGDG